MQHYHHSIHFLKYLFRAAPPMETDLDRELLLTQHLAFSGKHGTLAAIMIAVSSGIVVLTMSLIGASNVLWWAAMAFAMSAFLFFDWMRKHGRPKPKSVRGTFLARCERISYAVGACWASYPFFVPMDSPSAMLIAALVTPPMVAGLSSILPLNPRIAAPFAVGCAVSWGVYAAMVNTLEAWVLCAMLVVFLVSMYHGAKGAFTVYTSGLIAKRAAVDSYQLMTDALDASGQAICFRDEDGQITYANSTYSAVFEAAPKRASHGRNIVHVGGGVWQYGKYQAVSSTHVEIYTDVSELHRALETSKNHQEEAEYASMAQSRFLTAMRATLLGPLDTVIACSSVAGNESSVEMSLTELKGYADQIYHNGVSLRSSIHEILEYAAEPPARDVSEIGDGQYVSEALRNAVETVEMRLGASMRQRVEAHCADKWLHYFEDGALERIIVHLLENVLARSDDQVIVKVAQASGQLNIIVRGTGNGFSEAVTPSDGARGNYEKESHDKYMAARMGLGLPDSKRLAKRNGASVVDMITEGGVPVFAVVIPNMLVSERFDGTGGIEVSERVPRVG